MIKKMFKNIIIDKRGFSLTELLLTMAILVLAGSIVAAGMPAAQRAYQSAVDASNAQVLLSTSAARLRAELSVATDPVLAGNDAPTGTLATYVNAETGFSITLFNDSASGNNIGDGLSIKEDPDGTDDPDTVRISPLVPNAAAKGASADLRVEAGSITYDDQTGIFTIRNIKVRRGASEFLDGASIDVLEVRSLASEKQSEA